MNKRTLHYYDTIGLFSPNHKKEKKDIFIKLKGKYLCGYIKGTWDKLPKFYEKMLKYAQENHLELTGYVYEKGLNDFAIQHEDEYVTQILIKIKE